MTPKPMDDATLAQVRAADPEASTWVAANAGSGKTRVLTDRVARLLLNGTQPQKILCLTYTKAAAAEMQNRLFKRLGEWAMMPDDDLRAALSELGEGMALDAVAMRKARTLFANALETPGGLKIQTIHSFCDKLLRRFPLEAGVSPQFEVLEDRQAKLMRAEILEELADGTGVTAVDRLARFMSGLEPDALLAEIASKRKALDINLVRALFPTAHDEDTSAMLGHVLDRDSREVLLEAARVIQAEQTTKTDAPKLEKLATANSIEAFLKVAGGLLLYGGTAKAGPYSAKLDKLPSQKPTREAHPELVEALNEIMERTEEIYWLYVNHLALERAEAMAAFSTAFLERYDLLKTQTGRLDYDDLIARAGRLLSGSKAAEWVLYKLDGGIDHVLVDEAQDTSPSQWDVVKLLTDEFTAGDAGKDTNRTVFVVGDEKQSIYSFQGADPAEFDVMRQRFSERLNSVEKRLEEVELTYSFRSSDPILRLVDKVFDGPAGTGFLKRALHRPFKTELPGRVDLWPFEETEKTKDDTPWFKPVDTPAPDNPQTVLARKIAGWIKHILDRKQELPGQGRAVRASDFLILVQGRRPIFHNIIKELKLLDLPVAGADRLDVGQELAVRDMLSLLKFADLPEDDLSLAEALRSPLLGFSEDDLFRVAQPREKESLWQAMRAAETRYPAQLVILRDVLKQADFMRPYELIERILTLHKGRENILARLGSEAEDGIDELLSQAMRYEQLEAPSLPGFLNWFAAGKVEIKREMDSGAGQIRVMTVHGSKGLEAPIVILPDTEVRKGNSDSSQIMALKEGGFLWKSPEDLAPAVQNDAKEAAKEFADQERMRLLYVALTRAEQWLVVAGAGDRGKEGASWYNLVAEAMEQSDWMPVTTEDVPQVGACLTVHHNWSENPVKVEQSAAAFLPSLPDWANTQAPTVEKPPATLSPSELGGAKIVFGGLDGADKDTALRKGRQVHLLLEHLAKTPPANRHTKAQQLLVGDCTPLDDGEFTRVLAEASAVLDDPDLAHIFTSDVLAEVGVSAEIAELDGQRIDGIIDRLIVAKDRVLAIDFKTNATLPDSPETIPDGILRQLAAYRAALVQIYPNHDVEVAVLWTVNRQIMAVPHDIVMNYLQSPTTS
nr:double-strand break repair helicase AddA [Amylibacter sp.]